MQHEPWQASFGPSVLFVQDFCLMYKATQDSSFKFNRAEINLTYLLPLR